jgi:hypothetical protein
MIKIQNEDIERIKVSTVKELSNNQLFMIVLSFHIFILREIDKERGYYLIKWIDQNTSKIVGWECEYGRKNESI